MSERVANGGEARVLSQLTRHELEKGARSKKKHPAFLSMATLQPHKLSESQVGLALTWLGDATAAQCLDAGRCQARLSQLLPTNPLLTFNLALDAGCKFPNTICLDYTDELILSVFNAHELLLLQSRQTVR